MLHLLLYANALSNEHLLDCALEKLDAETAMKENALMQMLPYTRAAKAVLQVLMASGMWSIVMCIHGGTCTYTLQWRSSAVQGL